MSRAATCAPLSDATGAVTIETGSRGPGWSLGPPAGAECDATGTDCALRNAADGAHNIWQQGRR